MIYVVLAILLLLSTIHVVAMYAGYPRSRLVEKIAFRAGVAGMLCLVGYVLSMLDAFSQVWVKRVSYEGWPVWFFLVATIVTALVSLVTATVILVQENRPRRLPKLSNAVRRTRTK